MWYRLLLASAISLLCSLMNLWIYGKVLWGLYGSVDFEKITGHIAVISSIIWILSIISGLILGAVVM